MCVGDPRTREFYARCREHVPDAINSLLLHWSSEKELGAKLFIRRGRGVSLTPAGEAFLPSARASLVAAEAAREAVAAIGGLMSGRLSLVITPTLKQFVAEIVADFINQHPDVRVSVDVRFPTEALEMVRSSIAPLAFVGLSDLPDELTGVELFDEEIVAVFPPHTEIHESVTPDVLCRYPLVISRYSQMLQLKTHPLLISRDAKIIAEADNIDALLEFVIAGVGVAIMSAHGATGAAERGAVIVPMEPAMRYKTGLVYRRGQRTPIETDFGQYRSPPRSAINERQCRR